METEFVAAWARAGGRDGRDVYAILEAAYNGPGRYYHTLAHVGRMLRERLVFRFERPLDARHPDCTNSV